VESVGVEYHAPVTCPDERAFVAQVSARTARFRRALGGAARTFVVTLAPAVGAGVHGRLDAVDAGGARTSRELDGDTCEQVIRALALVTALAIDPNASLAPVPLSTAPPPAVPQPGPVRVRESPARGGLEGSWLDAGAGATINGVVAPGPLVGVELFVEGGLAPNALVSPSLRVGGELAPGASFDVPGSGSASFALTVALLEACPLHASLGPVTLAPCMRADAGSLRGEGSNIAHPSHETRLWADVGAVARGRWAPWRGFFLEIQGGLVFPLTRDRFHFDVPDVTINRAPAAGGTAAAGAGVRFW
jgi:hypothetical protein